MQIIKKLTHIFQYLQSLNQLRNPVKQNIGDQPWVLWFRDLPEHPSICRGSIPSLSVLDTDDSFPDSNEENDYFILKVRRPELKTCPPPPPEVAPWLADGWDKIDGTVQVKPPKNETAENGEVKTIAIDSDPVLFKAYEQWLAQREHWVKTESPAHLAMEIFLRLYRLYSFMEREAERVELILGDGLLSLPHTDGANIYHPLLLQRLQLHFDASVPEFTLEETEHQPELYTPLFRSIPEVTGHAINKIQDLFDTGSYHPLEEDETSHFFQQLIALLSPHGQYTGSNLVRGEKNVLRLGRQPVVFVRQRTLGFNIAIESILENLPQRQDIPPFLANIVGIQPASTNRDSDKEGIPAGNNANGEDENVFLCKEANAEQLQIAQRLEKYGAVLVQGPPGTGKTHTIANLLGHLLAQGKNVLVTSHTSKALRVLKDKVVEPLQPLCVSVLSDDNRSVWPMQYRNCFHPFWQLKPTG